MNSSILLTLLFFQFCQVTINAMQTLDMCANFVMETEQGSMMLHTPGYTHNSTYPNSSYCRCDVYTLIATSQPRSLNITILDLKLQACTATSRYDTLTLTTVHSFQTLYQISVLCGQSMPLSRIQGLSLSDLSGNLYGESNTLYSLEFAQLEFQADDKIELRGVKLMIESHRGLRVKCQGVSGDLTTTTTPTTTTVPTTYGLDPLEKARKERLKATTVTAAVVGAIATLFVIGLAIGVFILIRKRKTPAASSTGRRQSDGKPVYRDPCQGMPRLPMPGSVRLEVKDEYLYPAQGLTTPVYENPQVLDNGQPRGHTGPVQVVYENGEIEEGNTAPSGGASNEEVEYYGYIIPGSQANNQPGRNIEEGKPLIKGLVMTEKKPPIPQPKNQKPNATFALSKKFSNDSVDSQRPLISEEGSPEMSRHRVNNVPSAVEEPPSDLKGVGGRKPPPPPIKPLPNLKSNPQAVNSRPNYRMAGQLPPPPPPSKPVKAGPESSSYGDSFQVVNVETS